MKNILHTIFCALFFAPVIVLCQPFKLLKDINGNPNVYSSPPNYFTNLNGTFIFTADDGIHGEELWKSNGDEASTQLIRDINTTNSSYPEALGVFNNEFFFRANDGIHGLELWKTDGTEAGTTMVKDIAQSGGSYPAYLNILNGNIYFFAWDGINGSELWKSDGSENGTTMVKVINPSLTSGGPNQLFKVMDGTLYFVADDGTHGSEIWKSDGTESGTMMVKDINPGLADGWDRNYYWNFLTVLGHSIYFVGNDDGSNQELWKSDGTENGTVRVKDINPSGNGMVSGDPFDPVPQAFAFHDKLIFRAFHPDTGAELWASDGTEAGTNIIKDFYEGPTSGGIQFPQFAKLDDQLDHFYVSAIDANNVRRIWRTDGTPQGTWMVNNVIPPMYATFVQSAPYRFFVSHNGLCYFVNLQPDPLHGYELWRTDGTDAGTFMVKDILPGPEGQSWIRFTEIENLTFVVGANDGIHGESFWMTDGTEAGTHFVQHLDPDYPYTSEFYNWIAINGTIYAEFYTYALGIELWVSSLSALPISLFDFTGHLAGKDALLSWKTTGEEKNSSYILERSVDRMNFSPVTTISARNFPGTNAYDYTDLNIAQAGKTFAYYRIKQIEPNRQPSYSAIVAIRMSGGNYWVKIQPNPVKSQLNIQLNSNKSEHSTMSIVSMQGVVLMKKEITIRTGIQSISWDINRLPAGSYLLTIQDDEKITKEMFIKN